MYRNKYNMVDGERCTYEGRLLKEEDREMVFCLQ